MLANVNPETGIRYGTIYLHHLDHDTAAWLWDNAENVSEREALKELRQEISFEADDLEFEDEDERDVWAESEYEKRVQNLHIEEPTLEGEADDVKYMISHLGGAALLWVFESPVTGRFDLCSPCVPNACNLSSPNENGYEGYTVPADWLPKES